ncbi:D-alanyl-D-alanine carboxypeptidase/D-alanyl-D-alanine-endopeptidase [uncultured Microscilla sp.]|uniref:D-alanyl-D-alanine carboxypeptidase/D-alanyl-D-alanine endopeptidase n=1 Tax=uncultured Microscilla sp. TaxID=432653 RepID=UPI00262FFCCE|nr:D-alanyl-D-alanine carboxypeptidase/D-alanyl-D-alanine-endopeptidase [uncultured Microscilla sp.]
MSQKLLLYIAAFMLITLVTCSHSQQKQAADMPSHLPDNNHAPKTTHPTAIPIALKQLIDQLNRDAVLRHGSWALSIQDVTSGKQLVQVNPYKTMTVASSLKTVTTSAGLGILGGNYKFATQIQYDGALSGGVVNGNVYIKGGGDPTLGSPLLGYSLDRTMNEWVAAMKKAGIRKVKGQLIIDETLFEENVTPSSWIWADMGNYYAAPAGAINVLDNTYKLYLQPASRLNAAPKVLRTSPWVPRIQFVNHLKTAAVGTGDQAYIHGAPYDHVRYINGTIPMGGTFSIKGALPDPGFYLGVAFRKKLIQHGLMTNKNKATTTRMMKLDKQRVNYRRTLVHTHHSTTLKSLVKWINLYSINLYAEAVLKAIGVKQQAEGSTAAGAKAITQYWKTKGLSTSGLYIEDGSGLAQSNGITAYQLAQVQRLTAQQSYFQAYYQSLPVAGVSGTMRSLGRGTRAQNNLRAKTGGMTRVISFTGYFKNRAGQLRSFALIANQYTCKYSIIKAKLARLMVAMVEV